MSASPALIGISSRLLRNVPPAIGFGGKTLEVLEQSVARWLNAQGALGVMLPTLDEDDSRRPAQLDAEAMAQALDGLVLQGGRDVDPQFYGEEPRHIKGGTDVERDRHELALIHAFVAAGKPVLGICRCMQLLNVAFGGTLHQDLLEEGVTTSTHVDLAAYENLHHPVTIEPDSVLAQWHGGLTGARVNSIHHQGVARLGEGFKAIAHAPDGVIEAIWRDAPGFVLGVQWHPEFHDGSDPDLRPPQPVLRAFLDAALSARQRH